MAKYREKSLAKPIKEWLLVKLDIYSDPIFDLKNISTIVDKETILILKINGLRSLISEFFLQKTSYKSFFNFKEEYFIRNHIFSIKSIYYLLKSSNFKIDFLNLIKFNTIDFYKLFLCLFISTRDDIHIYIKKTI